MKPYSESCERNREPILAVLTQWFTTPGVVLEIGAGTGQHAVYFAERLPHLTWISTDRDENLPGVRAWFDEAQLPNLRGPLTLDVRSEHWPASDADYAFTANTAHIMSWPEVELMMAGVGRALKAQGAFCLYGPFNRDGRFTSESNRDFDAWLKARDPAMGVRDDAEMKALAVRCGLAFAGEHEMPANNRMLIFTK